ncbi:MAG TPA: LLM class flavin-dependent oxidoreductase [Nitrososphaeraceae archaeon]
MKSRKVRIGFNPSSLFATNNVIRFAKLADHVMQVDSIWIPESWGREAFSLLGAVSQVTTRIRLGTSVVNIYARSPATTAMAAFTLDDLAPNRFVIGLGVGTPALAENWHGIEFKHPVRRINEFAECFKLILTGQRVNYCGDCFRIRNFRILNRPTGIKVPIFLGAVNNQMVDLATRISNGVILYLHPLLKLQETVRHINAILKKSGTGNFEICCVFITAISEQDWEMAKDRAAKTLAFYIAVGKYYRHFLAENGFKKEVSLITSKYNREGVEDAAKCIPEKMLNSLTIFGSKEDCIKSLKRFTSTGISLPIMQVNPVGKPEDSISQSLSLATFV